VKSSSTQNGIEPDWSAISEEFRQIVAERKVVVQAGQAKAAQSVDTCGGTQRPRTVSG
jgi:hypothetical protein